MAWLFADSFDYYGTTADLPHSVWDSMPNAPNFAAGRFGGQAIQWGGVAAARDFLLKSFGSNEATIYLALAFYAESGVSGSSPMCCLRLTDGATNQCTITFDSDGAIRLRSGGPTGTVLAAYAGAVAQTTWLHFQLQVVIDPAAGSFTVRKNGALSSTFTATGLNTRGGTANSYVNGVTLTNQTSLAWGWRVDDLLVFSGSGAAPNTWVGDVRAICLDAAVETAQKQFIPTPATQTLTWGPGLSTVAGITIAANTVYYSGRFSPTKTGPLTQVVFSASMPALTGHAQVALYANDGPSNQPGTLLGTTAALTNPGASATFVFSSPIPVSPLSGYYFAVLTDASWNNNLGINTAGSAVYSGAQAYASGFPATAPTTLTLVGSGTVFTGVQLQEIATNVLCVSDTTPNADTDYVSSINVNDEDLYTVAKLPVVPFAILGVVTKGYIRKSDAGTRQGQLRVKSGTTEVAGVDTAVSSTYTYLARVDTTDPNTSAAWTAAAVNALQIGQKVTL